MGIKGRLTLVDDDQPGAGHEGFFGHLGGRRDHQTGPHHNKQITFARMLKRQRKVFFRQGLPEIHRTDSCFWRSLDLWFAGLVEDAIEKYETYFPGHNPIPMKKVINGYVKSVEGKGTGEIIRMYDNC